MTLPSISPLTQAIAETRAKRLAIMLMVLSAAEQVKK